MLTRRLASKLAAAAMATGTLGRPIAGLAAEASAAPAKIGVLCDMSGPISSLTGAAGVDAVRMAIEDFGGNVLGKPVELVWGDHQQSNEIGLTMAKRWFEREGVTLICCIDSSTMAVAIQNWAATVNCLTATVAASSDLTGSACSPIGTHWIHSTYALATSVVDGLSNAKESSWYFVAVDTNTGSSMTRDTTGLIEKLGGKVKGVVKHPFASPDVSPFLIQAVSSGAKIIVLANSGTDTINCVKAWSEFGLESSGAVLAVLGLQPQYTEAIGLSTAQGLVTGLGSYNYLNEQTKAFSKRFAARNKGDFPSTLAVGNYSSALHYLKSVAASGTIDAVKVSAAMKAMRVNDTFNNDVLIRADGQVMNDFYVLKAKSPAQQTGPHDDFELLQTLKGDQVYQAIGEQGCRLFPKT